MTYRKKMIEVALPLEAINKAAAREKSIRHGHPSTLHLWWARRPLAACRAVLFASLVDDPDSDPMFAGDEDIAASKRAELFNLIEELVLWENSNNSRVINRARAEIARCVATQKIEEGVLKKDQILDFGLRILDSNPKSKIQNPKLSCSVFEIRQLLAKPEQVNAFLAEHAPPVLDPFCGGGSIPLEAQRLGLRAYGSDLNPVPVLITKALIEIPPKFAGLPPVNPECQKKSKEEKAATAWQGARGLAEDVRYYGKWMRDEADKRIGHLYPKVKITEEMANDRPDLKKYVGQELTVIAWIWARTVASSNPATHEAHVPLVKSFWLSKNRGKEVWVEPVVNQPTNSYVFRVRTGKPDGDHDPAQGTVRRTGATCLLTNAPISLDYIRTQGKAERMGARLMAVVAEGEKGRIYLAPLESHERVALDSVATDYPDTEIPQQALGFRVQLYGMDKHYKLFTRRQLAVLTTFSSLVSEVRENVFHDLKSSRGIELNGQMANGTDEYGNAIATYLACTVDKLADLANSLCAWEPLAQCPRHLFGKQTISMVWDYAEGNPFGGSSGSWKILLENLMRSLESPLLEFERNSVGQVKQLDAAQMVDGMSPLIVSTDPPYYDNIGYADLSDFFYIWLRKSLASAYPSLFSTLLTPKAQELIAAPHRFNGDRGAACQFFETGLGKTFCRIRQVQNGGYPLTVYYAFKQAEEEDTTDNNEGAAVASTGWQTILEGLIAAEFMITGTWPMRTEMGSRMRGMNSNALASSIVLVCRPRSVEAPLATRKDFITALRRELPDSLRDLQHSNIAPVDLAQASIGPGMAVFTRYSKVMETDGSAMTVHTALGLINQALDEVLAEQEGEFDGDTRWALAWFEQFGMEEGPFGVAETLSKAKNTSVGGLVEAGFLKAQSGKVRLLCREELDAEWDPATDKRLTMWEVTQHLIRKLEQEGESAAAALVHKLGGMAEAARDLAYRLYSICERKKWATEALAYNGLVIAWPELTKLALAERSKAAEQQKDFGF